MPSFAVIMLALALGGQIEDGPASTAGTISVEIKGDGLSSQARAEFASAVAEAFSNRGFTTIDQAGHAALVAEIAVSRDQVGSVAAPAPKSDRLAQTGGSSSGVGTGISFALPSGKSSIVPLQRTKLEIRIERRGSGAVLWHGSAITVRPAGAARGRDAVVAADLSEALIRAYPGQSEETMSVP